MADTFPYRIYIEGRWEISDLYVFPHRYAEVYSFLYALGAAGSPDESAFREAFERYPWQGGYSAVNFYDDLYGSIPREQRLEIKRIEYASPGFIELGAILVIATQVDKILTKVFHTWDKVDRVYDGIHRRYRRRRLARLNARERERKLEEEHVRFAIEACKELSEAMGLEQHEALARLSPDPIARLKILMSFWRRLRELVHFIDEGKVRVEPEQIEGHPPKKQIPPQV